MNLGIIQSLHGTHQQGKPTQWYVNIDILENTTLALAEQKDVKEMHEEIFRLKNQVVALINELNKAKNERGILHKLRDKLRINK